MYDRWPMTGRRERFLRWFRENRRRTEELFSIVDESCYYERPIPLRHPLVFYEGHLPGFNVITHVKGALGMSGADERLDVLFARGIDPDDAAGADRAQASLWPAREEVRGYARACDRLMLHALEHEELSREDHPQLEGSLSIFTALEHEQMHHETLLYMLHRIDPARKRRPDGYAPEPGGAAPPADEVTIPAGRAALGASRGEGGFGWDNEFDGHAVEVAEFRVDRYNVTNARFLEFVESGAYDDPQFWTPEQFAWKREAGLRHPLFWEREGDRWMWRGMFDRIPLPESWPVYVTHAEAEAYARWRGKRLMSEAEFHRAAYGTPQQQERPYPWGDEHPDGRHGNFGFNSWDPRPVGSYPAGASAWGVHDLVGNGWEWTSTLFGPFAGFRPMVSYPQYSADFFDGKHYVMKGGSPATAPTLLRRSFRNWFRPNYPYAYATFRCARS
jgi:gamma-glutamyl hercynylcysteine S-oxide synthase